MASETKNIVMNDSPQAAEYRTVSGWVSADGRFYGADERTARWAGCTHVRCQDCSEVVEKNWLSCPKCRDKHYLDKYMAKPFKAWDGETPLCLAHDDKFFFDAESVVDYAEEHDMKVADLHLVICEPRRAREVEPSDFYCDDLPEDMSIDDVAPELADAFDELNKKIREYTKPLSWWEGAFRTKLTEEGEPAEEV